MVALFTFSFILSIFPLLMGCLSLPILLIQCFFSKQEQDEQERLIQQGKNDAWFYGLWLPTIIWTFVFIIYKASAYMFSNDIAFMNPIDCFGGIVFIIFYVLFHCGYLTYTKKSNSKEYKSYNASQIFKIVFSILLFLFLGLLCSLCYLLIKLRF